MPSPKYFATLEAYQAAHAEWSRKNGKKGGRARMRQLSKRQRSAMARKGGLAKAAKARGKG